MGEEYTAFINLIILENNTAPLVALMSAQQTRE
jgi:hypothetical protein